MDTGFDCGMTITQTISTSDAARIGATMLEEALAADVTVSASINSHRDKVTFICYGDDEKCFQGVRDWAAFLGLDVETYASEGHEFINAETERDGVRVRITSNRRVATDA